MTKPMAGHIKIQMKRNHYAPHKRPRKSNENQNEIKNIKEMGFSGGLCTGFEMKKPVLKIKKRCEILTTVFIFKGFMKDNFFDLID